MTETERQGHNRQIFDVQYPNPKEILTALALDLMKSVSDFLQTTEAELNETEEENYISDNEKNEANMSTNENQRPSSYQRNRKSNIIKDIRDVIKTIKQKCMGRREEKKIREINDRIDQLETEETRSSKKDQTGSEPQIIHREHYLTTVTGKIAKSEKICTTPREQRTPEAHGVTRKGDNFRTTNNNSDRKSETNGKTKVQSVSYFLTGTRLAAQ